MIVFIIAVLAIIANSAHVIAAWFARPPQTYVTGIAHYFADYFLYVSLMAQKGWMYTDHLFTNEALPPTWIYWLYTILGKLGNPFVVYNVSIVVFSALVLWLWWQVIKETVPTVSTRLIAFLFVATASGFAGAEFWFSPLPALNRLGGVPHQIFQTILLLSTILLFSRMMTKKTSFMNYARPGEQGDAGESRIMNHEKNKKSHLFPFIIHNSLFIILVFLAAIANPIQMLLLSLAIILTNPRMLPFLVPAVIGAIITNAEFARDPILTAAKAWENSQHISVSLWQFLLAIGPVVILIPLGLKRYMKDLTPLRRVLLSYGVLSVLVFFSPLPTLLGTSPVRWLSPAAYGAIPILAAFGLTTKKYVLVLLMILYSVFTIPSFMGQIESRMHAPTSLNYVPQEVIRRMKTMVGDGVVLTNPNTQYDVLIPVFTGRKSFTGHPIHTLYPDVKEALRKNYFAGEMTDEEKKQFLTDHNIETVYGP